MDKREFFERLRAQMRSVPQSETAPIYEYYNEIFSDAAEEGKTEEEVCAGLEPPETIAARVRAECAFAEAERAPGAKNTGKAVLYVVLALCAMPLALPLAIVVMAVLFAVFVTLFSLVLAVGAAVFALVVAGFAVAAAGFVMLVMYPAVGTLLMGIGLILIGLSLLSFLGLVASFKGVFALCGLIAKWVFRKTDKRRAYA